MEDITPLSSIPNFPSPDELKNKFVIKCKAPRRIPKVLTIDPNDKSEQKAKYMKLAHMDRK